MFNQKATAPEEKHEQTHIENADAPVHTQDALGEDIGSGLVKSRFDNESVWRVMWKFRTSAMYCFALFTAYIMDGMEVTMSGSIIANQGFMRQFGEEQADGSYTINEFWVSAWGAIINLGQILALTHIGWLADRYGRRFALCWGWLYSLAALICMTTAREPVVWLIAKLFVGMGVGTTQLLATPYVLEVSPVRPRGTLIILGLIWRTVGEVTCSVMMNEVNRNYPDFWLLPIYIEYAFIAIMIICYAVLPETPWFYGRKGDKAKAFKSMRRLYSNIPEYDYEEEWGVIVRTIAHEKAELAKAKQQSWKDIFTGLNGVSFGQIFSGKRMLMPSITYFFQVAGVEDPFQATMIQTCVALIAVFVYAYTIDRCGRRWTICLAYSLITVLLFIIGALWYSDSEATQTVLLIMVCLWQPCFTIYSNSYYLLAAELPSMQLRIRTGAFVWRYQAVWGMVLTFAAPQLLGVANIRAGFLYAGLSVPVAVFLWFMLPETKGRAIAEVDELFERRIPAWRWSKTTTRAETQLADAVSAEQRKLQPTVSQV